jgi:hypothetical protein
MTMYEPIISFLKQESTESSENFSTASQKLFELIDQDY